MRRSFVLISCLLLVLGLFSLVAPADATTTQARTTSVSSAIAPVPMSPPGGYNPIALARVFNTATAGALAPAVVRTVAVGGHGGVPSDASAVEVNVTVRAPAKAGSIAVFPGTSAYSGVATISFVAGVTTQRMITANLGTDGSVNLRNNVGGANLDVILDVVGFYSGGVASGPGSYHPIPGLRLSTPATSGAIRADGRQTILVRGRGQIPTGIDAVSVIANLTIQAPTRAGLLTVRSDDAYEATPVSYRAGAVTQEMVTISLGSGANLSLLSSNTVPVGVIVDVVGYFSDGSFSSPGGYIPIGNDPKAVPGLNPGVTAKLSLLPSQGEDDRGMLASGVWAVKLDFQVVRAPKAGSFSVWTDGEAGTGAATVSFPAADVGTYELIARVSAAGRISVKNLGVGGLIVSANVAGYFVYRGNPLAVRGNGVSAFPSPTRFSSVSCANAGFCVSGEVGGRAAVYNGRSWTTPAQIPGQTSLTQVACAASDKCFAAGNQLSEFNGDNWTPVLTGAASTAIACPASNFCLTTFANGYATWDGTRWTAAADTAVSIKSLSCATADFCLGFDGPSQYRIFDGTGWSDEGQQPGNPESTGRAPYVSCSSATFCESISTGTEAATFDGSSWTVLAHAANLIDPVGLSCASSTYCVAVDSSGFSVTFNGATWGDVAQLGAGTPLAISCTAVDRCVATTQLNASAHGSPGDDELAYSVTLSDRGWGSLSGLSNGYGRMVGLSCPTVEFCASVTDGGSAATSDGTNWASAVTLDAKGGLSDVACADATACLAVGPAGVWHYDGNTWSGPNQIDAGQLLTAVSCGTTVCIAGDDAGQAFVFHDDEWGPPESLGAARVSAMSCSRDDACLVLLADGTSSRYTTGRWQPAPSGPVLAATALSCASVDYCLASGPTTEGEWNGTVWTSTEPENFATVACTGSNECEGVGTVEASLIAWDGHYRSTYTMVGNAFGRTALSCPSASTCFYSDGNRTVYKATADPA